MYKKNPVRWPGFDNWNIEAVLNIDITGSNNCSETNIIDYTRVRV